MEEKFKELEALNLEIRKFLVSKDIDSYLNSLTESKRDELIEIFNISVNNSIILTNKINKNEGK